MWLNAMQGGESMATTTFSCRMDTEVKRDSEALYKELGMNLTTAINVFFKGVFKSRRISF